MKIDLFMQELKVVGAYLEWYPDYKDYVIKQKQKGEEVLSFYKFILSKQEN